MVVMECTESGASEVSGHLRAVMAAVTLCCLCFHCALQGKTRRIICKWKCHL